jgi:hypothetical protein
MTLPHLLHININQDVVRVSYAGLHFAKVYMELVHWI